jgi:hypothetical protein
MVHIIWTCLKEVLNSNNREYIILALNKYMSNKQYHILLKVQGIFLWKAL